jgi:hypothetical protein
MVLRQQGDPNRCYCEAARLEETKFHRRAGEIGPDGSAAYLDNPSASDWPLIPPG